MKNSSSILYILLLAALVFFIHLGTAALFDQDEAIYSTCAREMMLGGADGQGDWVVPMFNGELFTDKPPLMYWLMIAGFKLFGTDAFGARFFSAVLGIATVFLTYWLGKKLFNLRVGNGAAMVMATTIFFTLSGARAATVDSALTFLTTLAFYCFVKIYWRGENSVGSGQWAVGSKTEEGSLPIPGPRPLTSDLYPFIFLYAFLGVAVLAKGPIAFILPICAMGLFLMFQNYPEPKPGQNRWLAVFKNIPLSFGKSFWQLRPITGLIVLLIVAAPWFIEVGIRTQGRWLDTFIWKDHVERFMQPSLGHRGPFFYYIPALLIGFFPWSVFTVPFFIGGYRFFREKTAEHAALLFLTCWFGLWFIFWSICSSKLPHYLLPAYPALALMTGYVIDRWIADPACLPKIWMRGTWICAMVVGVAMIVVLPFVARIYLPGDETIGLVGIPLIVGGGIAFYLAERKKSASAMAVYGLTSAIFLVAMFGFAVNRVDKHQNSRPLLAEIKKDGGEAADICAYRFFRESMVFYAGHPITRYQEVDELRDFSQKTAPAYIITLDKYLPEIEKNYPGAFSELTRQKRFLAKEDMVVLRRNFPSEGK